MPLKIVLDTNIWVSYFINARADYLTRWIIDHDVTVYTSAELFNELEEVLKRPQIQKTISFSGPGFHPAAQAGMRGSKD